MLGRELQGLLPGASAPGRNELDVCDARGVTAWFRDHRPAVVVHAAAYTDVVAAERDRATCWRVNVGGTHAVVAAAREVGARLVHVSSDYVFAGAVARGAEDATVRGAAGYREDDPPGPTRNYYGLTKLVSEEVARSLPGTLVIRTSFRPREWPYPVAFTDLLTSQDYVDVVAPDIVLAIDNLERIPFATLHIAGDPISAFELARRRRPDVRPGSKREAAVTLPDDIVLDVSRWRALRSELRA